MFKIGNVQPLELKVVKKHRIAGMIDAYGFTVCVVAHAMHQYRDRIKQFNGGKKLKGPELFEKIAE